MEHLIKKAIILLVFQINSSQNTMQMVQYITTWTSRNLQYLKNNDLIELEKNIPRGKKSEKHHPSQ